MLDNYRAGFARATDGGVRPVVHVLLLSNIPTGMYYAGQRSAVIAAS
jgi:hypothetical protein